MEVLRYICKKEKMNLRKIKDASVEAKSTPYEQWVEENKPTKEALSAVRKVVNALRDVPTGDTNIWAKGEVDGKEFEMTKVRKTTYRLHYGDIWTQDIPARDCALILSGYDPFERPFKRTSWSAYTEEELKNRFKVYPK